MATNPQGEICSLLLSHARLNKKRKIKMTAGGGHKPLPWPLREKAPTRIKFSMEGGRARGPVAAPASVSATGLPPRLLS